MEDKIVEIIKNLAVGDISDVEVNLDTDLADELNFDSIMIIKMIIELNKIFEINVAEISNEVDFDDVKKVSDIVDLVKKCLQSQNKN